jgi:hypothetical protein
MQIEQEQTMSCLYHVLLGGQDMAASRFESLMTVSSSCKFAALHNNEWSRCPRKSEQEPTKAAVATTMTGAPLKQTELMPRSARVARKI